MSPKLETQQQPQSNQLPKQPGPNQPQLPKKSDKVLFGADQYYASLQSSNRGSWRAVDKKSVAADAASAKAKGSVWTAEELYKEGPYWRATAPAKNQAAQQEAAATKIQAQIRGNQARAKAGQPKAKAKAKAKSKTTSFANNEAWGADFYYLSLKSSNRGSWRAVPKEATSVGAPPNAKAPSNGNAWSAADLYPAKPEYTAKDVAATRIQAQVRGNQVRKANSAQAKPKAKGKAKAQPKPKANPWPSTWGADGYYRSLQSSGRISWRATTKEELAATTQVAKAAGKRPPGDGWRAWDLYSAGKTEWRAHELGSKDAAATKIQAQIRGNQVRKQNQAQTNAAQPKAKSANAGQPKAKSRVARLQQLQP